MSALDREAVETLLDIAQRGHAYVPASEVMAELCRTWLAVEDAPEWAIESCCGHEILVPAVGEWNTELNNAASQLVGHKFRLVPSSGEK